MVFGQPVVLYSLPELFNTVDRGLPVTSLRREVAKEQRIYQNKEQQKSCADHELQRLCEILMTENDFYTPKTATEAKLLYFRLQKHITNLLSP